MKLYVVPSAIVDQFMHGEKYTSKKLRKFLVGIHLTSEDGWCVRLQIYYHP